MNYYNEIKNKLIDNEVYSKIKDYSKERHKVITYFEIGKLLNEAGGKYGDNIIDEYSKKLVVDVGKKYNRRTLFRMKQFYTVFSDEKVTTMLTQLTWSHYLLLLSFKDYDEIIYYINIAKDNNLTQRQLQEKIQSNEYKRLPIEAKNKFIKHEKLYVSDLIPNPIKIKNKNNYEVISEKILQKLILEDIPTFLKELGNGFTFIDNEYKIKLGDRYNYVDLLLYNIKYKCYVVVELKITELKKEHTGQIMTYMNYIDKNIKTIEENKTVGIIICKRENKYVIEFCSDDRIIAREYELV
jgi:predicted nuclease of restriction endonuclease-like (RecB) superfamily